MRVFSAIGLAGALSLMGCASTPSLEPGPGLVVAETTELPKPVGVRGDERAYLIGPLDKLNVDVFGVEDLSRKVQVDASGRIAIPLAGTIEAAGKAPSELAATIADRLREYVRDPHVTVNLEEAVSQVVTVGGQVKKPGLYPVLGGMTLMRAIANAEGTTEFARLNEVVLFRTVNGQRYAALYNLQAIRRGTYEDPEVFANDVIMVGDSEARRLFRDAIGAAPGVLTPLIYLFRN